MNYLWTFMILTGIIYGAFHGTLPQITTAALDSAKEAVTLCITMMGVMSFWVVFDSVLVRRFVYANPFRHSVSLFMRLTKKSE